MSINATQIGIVEVLRTRSYPLDASVDGGAEVLVEPGTFPVYREGTSILWIMTGRLNLGGVVSMGDGLVVMTPGDVLSDLGVTFPSRRFGDEQFADLLAEPTCTEGHSAQRLRFSLDVAVSS